MEQSLSRFSESLFYCQGRAHCKLSSTAGTSGKPVSIWGHIPNHKLIHVCTQIPSYLLCRVIHHGGFGSLLSLSEISCGLLPFTVYQYESRTPTLCSCVATKVWKPGATPKPSSWTNGGSAWLWICTRTPASKAVSSEREDRRGEPS